MSTASSSPRSGVRVGPILVTAAIVVVCLSVWAAAVVPNPIRAQLQGFLNFAWLPAAVLAALMVGLAVAAVALLRSDASEPEDRVEPLSLIHI